ncbi:hypothetical protein EWB00_010529, partial [Schistosoma japonicum]
SFIPSRSNVYLMGGEFDFTHVRYCFLYPLLFVLYYSSDSFSVDTSVFLFSTNLQK